VGKREKIVTSRVTTGVSFWNRDNGVANIPVTLPPHRFKINKQYFERKEFTRKKAEDIIGGADAWKNVDKMDGSLLS